MPLKEIKEPKGDKSPKEKSDIKPPGEDRTDPWKTLPDGTKVRQGRKLPYENQLQQLFTEISGAVSLADSFSAQAIKNQAEPLAYGYAKLAKEDERVKAFFERALKGSAYSAVVVPTACVLIPVLWHFGFMPGKVGAPVTFMAGLPLVTREEEIKAAQQAFKEQQEAAAAQSPPTHPMGEAPSDNSGT